MIGRRIEISVADSQLAWLYDLQRFGVTLIDDGGKLIPDKFLCGTIVDRYIIENDKYARLSYVVELDCRALVIIDSCDGIMGAKMLDE